MTVKFSGEIGKSFGGFSGPVISLPTKGNTPPRDLEAFSYYIYGQHKIGKTSFTTMFNKGFHLFYEPGGKDYGGIFSREPKNWVEFLGYVKLLEDAQAEGELEFKTTIIDPVDLCYWDCLIHTCKTMHGSDYPPTTDFGKTWNKIGTNFREAIYRLAKISGVVFVSHAKEVTITKHDDSTYDMIRPTAANKCHEILSKFCDLTGYFHMDKNNTRIMRIIPDMHMEAGNRFENHFRYKGTDKPIVQIDMGTSKKDAYNNFLLGFNNEVLEPRNEDPKSQKSSEEKKETALPSPIKIKRI